MDCQQNGNRLSALVTQVVDEMMQYERVLASEKVENWAREIANFSESEIERLLYVALRSLKELQSYTGWCQGYQVEIVPPPSLREKYPDLPRLPFDEILNQSYLASRFSRFCVADKGITEMDFIWPQQAIGQYRADFAICRARYDVATLTDDVPAMPYEDVCYDELVRLSVPVIIECDGHDFHERTKGQAQHDRERDRYMQKRGYRVMRFTGSELYRDPMKCAKELDDFLASDESVAKKQYLSLL